jgi:transposase
MEVLYPRCAGLDVHQRTVVACARVAEERKVQQEVKTFETTTKGLLALAEWLKSFECTHVAMESTGVYWKPVWHVLEGDFELVLANAAHIRNVPGRKTDVNDAMWIADLLAHGLIRPSFVPPAPVQQLRDLTRTRKQMVGEMSRHMQRIQKTLEDANIKLTGIISDIFGKSGRKVLQALIDGETRAEALVKLMDARIKAPRAQILDALQGRITEHHRFLLKLHLDQIDALQAAVDSIESRIGDALRPFREAADLLTTIPGYGDLVAQTVVGEIGLNMSRFPSAAHLVSWARLCPRSDESAGKRRSTRTHKGGRWLKTVLVQAAWSAVRAKNNYFRSQFFRLKARRGPMKAIIAVAASMLTAAYHMLKNRVPYRELGSRYLDTIDRLKTAKRLLKRLADLGVHVAPLSSTAVSF